MVHVTLIATFRLVAGIKSIELDTLPDATIQDAVNRIIEQHPVLRSHWLDAAGALHAHVHIFYNGEDIANLPLGLKTTLHPEDTLDFLPPVAGG